MKFILHEITIWFKRGETHQRLELKPNKVNVVTGDSASGKTNILAIIDYCLLSGKVNIVDQVINETAEWYSLFFSVEGKKYFLARKKTSLDQPSSEVCFIESEIIPDYPSSNQGLDLTKSLLDSLFSIAEKEKYPYGKLNSVPPVRISYRTFLLFSYLTERIITLDNTFLDFDYFEETLFGDYKSYIVNKAIGIDLRKKEEAARKRDELWRNQKSFNNKQSRAINKNNGFQKTLNDMLKIFRDNDMLPDGIEITNTNDTIRILKDVITRFDSISILEQNNNNLKELKKQRRALNIQCNNIVRAEQEIKDYRNQLENYKDSLKPIQVLNSQANEIVRSIETQQLINALEKSLTQISNADERRVSNTLVDPIEKEILKKQIEILDAEIAKLTSINDNKIHSSRQYLLAGLIKSKLENLLIGQNSILKVEDTFMDNFYEKIKELETIIEKEDGAMPTFQKALNASIQFFYDKLNHMSNYTGCEATFNYKKFIVQLRRIGNAYPYDNIGSKSNYMFLHLCFFLGLHKHVLGLDNNHVLPFLFIDQPSIPYYAGSENVNNDDKENLNDAFWLLNSFITLLNEEYQTDFQILLIEHAPPSYWTEAKLENFYLVAEFTKGIKLIPQDILNSRNDEN